MYLCKVILYFQTKTAVQKNQNTITQFFKTTSSSSAVPLTKSIEENQANRLKRKATSPVKVASKTQTVITTEICDTFKRLKSDLDENHFDDQILLLNSPTKLGQDLQKVHNSLEKCVPSPDRLPLCSMDNIQSSPEDAMKSQKLALVTENPLFQSPKKNRTPKKKIGENNLLL